ncbi:hypothetical protein ACEN9X_08515 [Mucilaginibacter sp. Mucisp86]|uniref:DUF7003 family protein n=1 Tax=Mucilaginibacter sp. Mucisp86 TaxID=3243060 RepID=UPI0039B44227
MKPIPIIGLLTFALLFFNVANNTPFKTSFTEKEILTQLDLAFKGIPSEYYPVGKKDDIKYNFFFDLEHGYFSTAGNHIHLYADASRWAIVFEKSGYANRGGDAEIELNYIGNCINYPIDKYPERNYITNVSSIILITGEEYERIQNKSGSEMEQFELVDPNANYVIVRGHKIKIEHSDKNYTHFGIKPRGFDNPKRLISFKGLVRYLSETQPSIVNATNDDIKAHLPGDLPEISVIDKFHFESVYQKHILPSNQETYQLIAKVLVTGNPAFWKPKNKPNNHWSNWESGNL